MPGLRSAEKSHGHSLRVHGDAHSRSRGWQKCDGVAQPGNHLLTPSPFPGARDSLEKPSCWCGPLGTWQP